MKSNTLLTHYVPFLAWLSMIQYASSQPYQDQDVTPILGNINLSWIESGFQWVQFTYGTSVISLETRSTEAFVEFFIRKGAHVFVYFVLAIFAFRILMLWMEHIPKASVLAILFITAYAAYDEIRHYFHPDRSGMVEDVLLDMFGGALGVLAWIVFIRRRK
ncbi:VanZ family protein [Alteribacter populi]|uniref:VanZ family protein n=1 Tax=Alteribacter populi TaxID=2011011 RepID=UPI000BBB0870|nr:VanZ family protein [Alteribacter populi]